MLCVCASKISFNFNEIYACMTLYNSLSYYLFIQHTETGRVKFYFILSITQSNVEFISQRLTWWWIQYYWNACLAFINKCLLKWFLCHIKMKFKKNSNQQQQKSPGSLCFGWFRCFSTMHNLHGHFHERI